jgi:hypothetical protein
MYNIKRWLICAFLFLICFLILRFLNSNTTKEGYNTRRNSLLSSFGYNNGNGFAGYVPGERGYISRYGLYGDGPKWTN